MSLFFQNSRIVCVCVSPPPPLRSRAGRQRAVPVPVDRRDRTRISGESWKSSGCVARRRPEFDPENPTAVQTTHWRNAPKVWRSWRLWLELERWAESITLPRVHSDRDPTIQRWVSHSHNSNIIEPSEFWENNKYKRHCCGRETFDVLRW